MHTDDGESTGVASDHNDFDSDESTGVASDSESDESTGVGKTEEDAGMDDIDAAIAVAQAERDAIAEARTHKELQEAVNMSSDEDTNDGEEGDADDGNDEEVYQANPTFPMQQRRYNLRKNRTRDYRYRHQHQAAIIHYAPTQLSLRRGLQTHK